MGLDVSAFSKVDWTQKYGEEMDGKPNMVYVYVHPMLPERASDIPGTGWYRHNGRETSGRVSSYTGYNIWRSRLAELVGVQDRDVWRNPDKYSSIPFFELIHFSDCEGTIGPAVSAKLAKDFADWETSAERLGELWMNTYRKFKQWVELAADGGCVCFH